MRGSRRTGLRRTLLTLGTGVLMAVVWRVVSRLLTRPAPARTAARPTGAVTGNALRETIAQPAAVPVVAAYAPLVDSQPPAGDLEAAPVEPRATRQARRRTLRYARAGALVILAAAGTAGAAAATLAMVEHTISDAATQTAARTEPLASAPNLRAPTHVIAPKHGDAVAVPVGTPRRADAWSAVPANKAPKASDLSPKVAAAAPLSLSRPTTASRPDPRAPSRRGAIDARPIRSHGGSTGARRTTHPAVEALPRRRRRASASSACLRR